MKRSNRIKKLAKNILSGILIPAVHFREGGVDRLNKNPNIDLYRHLSFAAVGGFFGAYAILCRCGVLASAQTMNLLELTIEALRGDGIAVLLHLGALALYVLGTMLTVLLPHYLHVDMHLAAPVIDAIACVILCFIPAYANVLLSLYPIFFAMSVQWSSFPGARGFTSSTIFSTNNTKQASLALAEYITDGDRSHFKKFNFYALTLLAFHIGAAVSFFAVKFMGVRGAWVNILLAAVAFYMALCENKYNAVKNLVNR